MNLSAFQLGSLYLGGLFFTVKAAQVPQVPQFFTFAGMITTLVMAVLTIRKLWWEGTNSRLDADAKRKNNED